MTAETNARVEELAAHIDTIERAYEYMLAYAAQGRLHDDGASATIREYLGEFEKALSSIAELTVERLGLTGDVVAPTLDAFLEVVRADAKRALVIVRLMQSLPTIASQAIDNVNASIHIRTLLTDLFIVDDTVKRFRSPS